MLLSEATRGKTPRQENGPKEVKITYLSLDELMPSRYNFYSMSDLDTLADAIEVEGGIIQPVLVRRIAPHRYEIVSGHRRCAASQKLVDRGLDRFRMIPCRIEDGDELYTRLNIILSNSMREKTAAEKVREVAELRSILKDLSSGSEEDRKKFCEITHVSLEDGKNVTERMLRTLVSRQEGISETNYNRMLNIERNLHPDLKSKFSAGQIGIVAAATLASESEEEQESANAELESQIEAGEKKLRIPKKAGKGTKETAPAAEEAVSIMDTEKAVKEFHENMPASATEETAPESDTQPAEEPAAETDPDSSVIVLNDRAKETIREFLALFRSYTTDPEDWMDVHMRIAEIFQSVNLD